MVERERDSGLRRGGCAVVRNGVSGENGCKNVCV